MIQQTTLKALSQLFPDQTENGVELLEEDTLKNERRPNGIIKRDYNTCGYHIDIQIAPDQLIDSVTILDQNDYFLEAITGVDWIKENELEAVYDFSRYDTQLCRVVIRVKIPREDPHLPTITTVYAGANWHERETHDFFGIIFDGHPHLIPLLLPDDADFHPLLKDFK